MTDRAQRIIEALTRVDYRNQTPQRLAEAIAEVDGAPQSPFGREEIARIIDPVAFEEGSTLISWKHRRDAAEEKADEILALTRPLRQGETNEL